MFYGHSSIVKGVENVIISKIFLHHREVEKDKTLYLVAIPDIKNHITSAKIYFKNSKNLKGIIGIFKKEARLIVKYPLLNNSLVVDFTSDQGADLTPALIGKSFKELIGVDGKSEYFIGLEFLSDAKEDNEVKFILKYI